MWTAANLGDPPRRRRDDRDRSAEGPPATAASSDGGGFRDLDLDRDGAAGTKRWRDGDGDGVGRRRSSRAGGETSEAALARLTSSYGRAMGCVGALHRAGAALVKAREKSEAEAAAARAAAEEAGGSRAGSDAPPVDTKDSAAAMDVSGGEEEADAEGQLVAEAAGAATDAKRGSDIAVEKEEQKGGDGDAVMQDVASADATSGEVVDAAEDTMQSQSQSPGEGDGPQRTSTSEATAPSVSGGDAAPMEQDAAIDSLAVGDGDGFDKGSDGVEKESPAAPSEASGADEPTTANGGAIDAAAPSTSIGATPEGGVTTVALEDEGGDATAGEPLDKIVPEESKEDAAVADGSTGRVGGGKGVTEGGAGDKVDADGGEPKSNAELAAERAGDADKEPEQDAQVDKVDADANFSSVADSAIERTTEGCDRDQLAVHVAAADDANTVAATSVVETGTSVDIRTEEAGEEDRGTRNDDDGDDGNEADTEDDPRPPDSASSIAPLDPLSRVAVAARSSLRSLLLDPLLRAHCPTLREALEEEEEEEGENEGENEGSRPGHFRRGRLDGDDALREGGPPMRLISAAHRSATRELSYLALVNYADLLWCGCGCACDQAKASRAQVQARAASTKSSSTRGRGRSGNKNGGGEKLLERGVVRPLEALLLRPPPASGRIDFGGGSVGGGEPRSASSLPPAALARQKRRPCDGGNVNANANAPPASAAGARPCLWSGEGRERTARLALAAYCDASALDGADPTLWLRTACAARGLGRARAAAAAAAMMTTETKRGEAEKVANVRALDVDDGAARRGLTPSTDGGGGGGGAPVEQEGFERKTPPAAADTTTPSSALSAPGKDDDDEAEPEAPAPAAFLPYRRLETHALEMGLKSLPPGAPPNRALTRAWRESRLEDAEVEQHRQRRGLALQYPPALLPEAGRSDGRRRRPTVTIDLTRYSWSALGRALMKACREGSAYHGNSHGHRRAGDPHSLERGLPPAVVVGSPAVELRISPVLALPPTALWAVCEFLGAGSATSFGPSAASNNDVENLESTCRALSSSVLSARASAERDRTERAARMEAEMTAQAQSRSGGRGGGGGGAGAGSSGGGDDDKEGTAAGEGGERDAAVGGSGRGGGGVGRKRGRPPASTAASSTMTGPPRRRERRRWDGMQARASKRVRSQLITSGRQAERSTNRLSAEYSLVSVLFRCAAEHPAYMTLLKRGSAGWSGDVLRPLSDDADGNSAGSANGAGEGSGGGKGAAAVPRAAPGIVSGEESSLRAFLRSSGDGAGPREVLRKFLACVSLHPEEAFGAEVSGGAVVLSSCVMECFDLVRKKGGHSVSLSPSWYGDDSSAPLGDEALTETFAVNLLNAELRLRRCERQAGAEEAFFDGGYEGDAHSLLHTIPKLLGFAASMPPPEAASSRSARRLQAALQARCHWLAAGYYLWWSRASSSSRAADVAEAEDAAACRIREAIAWLGQPAGDPIVAVVTPHLESPGRCGTHWGTISERTLSAFQDELQAAGVVSRARRRFLELRTDASIDGNGNSAERTELTEEQAAALLTIGHDMLERYGGEYAGPHGKHGELVDDFLRHHAADLVEARQDAAAESGDANSVGSEPAAATAVPQLNWTKLSGIVPSSKAAVLPVLKRSSDPCLLSILTVCLQAREGSSSRLLRLFVHVASACVDRQRFALKQTAGSQSDDDGGGLTSDSEGEADSDAGSRGSTGDDAATELLSLAAKFLIESFNLLVVRAPPAAVSDIAASPDFTSVVHTLLAVSGNAHDKPDQERLQKAPPDLSLFFSAHSLVSGVTAALSDDAYERTRAALESSYFEGLLKLIVFHRLAFPLLLRAKGDQRHGRTERYQLRCVYAHYIAALVSEVALRLSETQATLLPNDRLVESRLLRPALSELCAETRHLKGARNEHVSSLVQATESLLWFWKYISSSNAVESAAEPVKEGSAGPVSSNTLEKIVAKHLVVPVASAIVSLCGAAGHDASRNISLAISTASGQGDLNAEEDDTKAEEDDDAFSDYFDSDDSANGWSSDDSVEGGERRLANRRSLLRTLVQAVQCCHLVFSKVDDETACEDPPFLPSPPRNGPLLPLVAVRTFTNMSDLLLASFTPKDADDDRRGIWAEAYPFGAQSAGALLDSLLFKAYRCLHGFTLYGQNYAGTKSKDLYPAGMATSLPAVETSKPTPFKPESIKAAAQLYRCIRRAYSKSRRSPPKRSLECVESSLPEVEESTTAKAIRRFVFSSEPVDRFNSAEDASTVIAETLPAAISLLPDFPAWVLDKEKAHVADKSSESPTTAAPVPVGDNEITMREIRLVKKGICHELAAGPLPKLGSDACTTGPSESKGSSSGSTNESVERETSARHEQALWKKFRAILAHLCHEPTNSDAWYRAGLCLNFKAELICDRLPLIAPYTSSKLFPSATGDLKAASSSQRGEALSALITKQFEDHSSGEEHNFLGNDLSVYMRHPWTKFSELRLCAKEVGEKQIGVNNDLDEASLTDGDEKGGPFLRQKSVWNEIESRFLDEDYGSWERAWGSMFVAACQNMGKKCLTTALYFAEQNAKADRECDDPAYDISECIGTVYYGELMGGGQYGYPMKTMNDYLKRKLARKAREYFLGALSFVPPSESEVLPEEPTYEQHFMIGKCNEKNAKTLVCEAFPAFPGEVSGAGTGDQPHASRAYACWMERALSSYSKALMLAQRFEKERGMPSQGGGSSHGVAEIVYRIHATRLKVLLTAVRQPKQHREAAELEALRLTTQHWFNEKDDRDTKIEADKVRKLVWEVLADVVAAMAQLRIDYPYFHRSIYRHTQAFLWAPILHDPENAPQGSLGSVPATKSYHLRGLSTGNCAHSAEVIIGSLFEKKRPQLCAVWVTTPAAPSPFEVLNDTVRKYDSLRSKYIGAFIDCMKLCKRRETLMSFWGWTTLNQRDLPSFYEASAAAQGGVPNYHNRENLLTASGLLGRAKQCTNSAIAEILLQDIEAAKKSRSNQEGTEEANKEASMALLQAAFSCFLRLNCPTTDLHWHKVKIDNDRIWEVEAICQAHKALYGETSVDEEKSESSQPSEKQGAWNFKMASLKSAVSKCEELFPSLARRKRRGKSKVNTEGTTTAADLPSVPNAAASDEIESEKQSNIESKANKKKTNEKPSEQKEKPEKKNKLPAKHKTKTRMVVVSVPKKLKVGDSFEVNVKIGTQTKKVKLTVPEGKPSKLKFPIKVPRKKSKGGKLHSKQGRDQGKAQEAAKNI